MPWKFKRQAPGRCEHCGLEHAFTAAMCRQISDPAAIESCRRVCEHMLTISTPGTDERLAFLKRAMAIASANKDRDVSVSPIGAPRAPRANVAQKV
jgi:hypothetical protein